MFDPQSSYLYGPQEYETSTKLPALFDAHVHFRQMPSLPMYVYHTARVCDYAVVMPNTTPIIGDGYTAKIYREQIVAEATKHGYPDFRPLMTLYLTQDTTPAMIESACKTCPDLVGVKIYPTGATTNSHDGIPFSDLADPLNRAKFRDCLKAIAHSGLVLQVHGENPDAPLLDREPSFIRSGFVWHYANRYPFAKVTLEHVTSRKGVEMLLESGLAQFDNVAGTVTLHHLCMTIDDVVGRADNFCRPVALDNDDRSALVRAVNFSNVLLGSDSAPHSPSTKYCASACAGCYTAPVLAEGLLTHFMMTSIGDRKLIEFSSERALKFYDRKPTGRMLNYTFRSWVNRGFLDANMQASSPVVWGAGRNFHYQLLKPNSAK